MVLVGWGRMGREIEQAARERGHAVVLRVDPSATGPGVVETFPAEPPDADVALEFSEPSAAAANVRGLLEAGLPVVSGTTGWSEALPEARELAGVTGTGFLWAPNFALGVNLLFRMVDQAASWLGASGEFSPYLIESHHDGKKDGPSGTGTRLAEALVERTPGKERHGPAPAQGRIDPQLVPVAWVRAGSIPGEHRVGWDAAGETIEIVHRARSRSIFAAGAVRAAEWLRGRRGPFTLDDMLDDMLGSAS
jgi:4-hydroxy-tetrahydrodipicolinate reductase